VGADLAAFKAEVNGIAAPLNARVTQPQLTQVEKVQMEKDRAARRVRGRRAITKEVVFEDAPH
jgi:hypothetical protein